MYNTIKVTVTKELLLEKLKANREKHKDDYDKAKIGFAKLLEAELRKKLKDHVEGKKVSLTFKNRKPSNYLKEYDDVIGMIEISTDTNFVLDHTQFKQYIKNEWTWMQDFMLSNSAYIKSATVDK